MQWLSRLYYADFISFYSPTQLCEGGTTKSNSNEFPISVPASFSIGLSPLRQEVGLLFQDFRNILEMLDEYLISVRYTR